MKYFRYKVVEEGGNELVHYKAIHEDVTEVDVADFDPFAVVTGGARSALLLAKQRRQQRPWEQDDLSAVAKLAAKCAEYRIQLRDFFSDFDLLRKRHCTVQQVKF
jgi:hypothetical protein